MSDDLERRLKRIEIVAALCLMLLTWLGADRLSDSWTAQGVPHWVAVLMSFPAVLVLIYVVARWLGYRSN